MTTNATIALDSAVSQADGVLYRNLEGEAVLVHLASGACFELDAIGTEVWEMIGRGETLVNVLEALAAEYDVERSVVTRDLVALVNELAIHGLVQISKGPPDSDSSAV
jgi:hypothetical protein